MRGDLTLVDRSHRRGTLTRRRQPEFWSESGFRRVHYPFCRRSSPSLPLVRSMMNSSPTLRAVAVVLVLFCLHARAGAQPPDAKGLAHFESKIRPVLVKECYQCHSAEAAKNKKLRGGLLLDTREGIRKGGDGGPAVVPGDVKKSLLLAALRHDDKAKVERMPPRGKLPDEVI